MEMPGVPLKIPAVARRMIGNPREGLTADLLYCLRSTGIYKYEACAAMATCGTFLLLFLLFYDRQGQNESGNFRVHSIKS